MKDTWIHRPDLAQYGGGDWSPDNIVTRSFFDSPEEAMEFADRHPEITFFVWGKGQMVLSPNEHRREPVIVYPNEAVFFRANLWVGSAPCLADIYEKRPCKPHH
eukprot:gnl/Chilomastix_cuspidata/1568.p1 GENE.gnl/Chilomastix_cuspidata/1568~~gnl/Chilomastix_cuspidata/1568.p1  ORF type:complete len:113 (+),score=14.95 gnl/Chilomastix_cuspidata/1568:30-341(+)